MGFTTATEFKQVLTAYLDRTPGVDLDDFIQLAEARLRADLTHTEMETEDTGMLSSGQRYLELPADYLETRAFYLPATVQPIVVVTPWRVFATNRTNETGLPSEAARLANRFYFNRIPDSDYEYVHHYVQSLVPLRTNASNWLLLLYPNLYLAATMLEVSMFLEDDANIQKWASSYATAIGSVELQDTRSRWRGMIGVPRLG